MKTVRTGYIGKKRAGEIGELIGSVNRHDGTRYGMADEADAYCLLYEENGRLAASLCVYRLGETIGGKAVTEIAAFTRPECRRQKYFTALLKKAAPDIAGSILRFGVCENEDAAAVLARLGAVHDYDELMLSLSLTGLPFRMPETGDPAARTDVAGTDPAACTPVSGTEPIAHIDAAGTDPTAYMDDAGTNPAARIAVAGTDPAARTTATRTDSTGRCAADADRTGTSGLTVDRSEGHAYTDSGECFFRTSGQTAYIFGVLTYAGHRRQGCARRLLTSLFAELQADGITTVRLQVSSENTPALALYRSLGMTETDRLSYYLLFPAETGK